MLFGELWLDLLGLSRLIDKRRGAGALGGMGPREGGTEAWQRALAMGESQRASGEGRN